MVNVPGMSARFAVRYNLRDLAGRFGTGTLFLYRFDTPAFRYEDSTASAKFLRTIEAMAVTFCGV